MIQKNEDLVEIYRAHGETAAQIIKSKLESFGIPVILISQAAPSVHAFAIDGMGEYQVMVLSSMAEEASSLIKGEEDV